jgi:hypothetical protein
MLRFIAFLITVGFAVYLAVSGLRTPAGVIHQKVSIEALDRSPGQYDGRSVEISGVIADRMSVLGAGAYRVRDDEGRHVVVIGLARMPGLNERVTVSGMYRVAFTFGVIQIPVLVVAERSN